MILKVKRHNQVDFFNKFTVTLNYDTVASVFSFDFYFDPNNKLHKQLWKPGHYHEVDVEHNEELLVRGRMLSQVFTDSFEKSLSSISGYSLPGVLEDCQIPTSLYPLQSDGKTLLEIANRVTSLFKFDVVVDSAVSGRMNKVYDTVTANEGESIKRYLSNLASERNIILSHTPEGNLLFTEAKTRQTPIFHFSQGIPNLEMSLTFNGQNMHSDITVQKQASIDSGNASEASIKNPFVPFTFRPLVISQRSGTDIDAIAAAKNTLSAELKNIVLTIKTNIWEIEGKVIKPNNIITVINPKVYLYKKTKWFIQSVKLVNDESKTTAILTCVLPEVYNGETPEYIFEFDDPEV